jgi:HAD superfamily hydrolase (TIGR01450 family)
MSVTLPAHIRSLILDMDGVLWKADAPIGDLPRTFDRMHERGLKVAFATNNGTQTPEQYVERLAKLGVIIDPWQVVTSALGVANLLKQEFPSGGPIFVIGGEGVKTALCECGFELLSTKAAKSAKAVVMGIDPEINFEKMSEAALLVRSGVPFFATNPDKTFPTPRGQIPGAGAWIAVIITATGVEPIYAGKPAPYLFELARTRLGTTKNKPWWSATGWKQTLPGARRPGCQPHWCFRGKYSAQAERWQPKVDMVVEDLAALHKISHETHLRSQLF